MLKFEQLADRAYHRRAVEAAIWGIPLVNVDYMRQAYFRAGAKFNDAIFWSRPNSWMNQTTTPNHSTSYRDGIHTNADGSVDVVFASEAPKGQEDNWILTRPGKPFFVMFRIYGPQKGAVDGGWVLNDIEKLG